MQNEIWKDIPNYEGLYQVSNLGIVKSLPRVKLNQGKYPFITKEKIIKLFKDDKGYYMVKLTANAKEKTFKVHQLVAISFLGHKPCGYKLIVDHINNKKNDNRVENLQLITPRENSSKDRKGYSSKYVGVSWCKSRQMWEVKIKIEGKSYSLGRFKDEYQAHLAYQNKLKEIENV